MLQKQVWHPYASPSCYFVNPLQLGPQWTELVEPQRVGTIGKSTLRSFVNFDEDSVHSRCDGGARQRRDELRLPARRRSCRSRHLHAVRRIEDDGPTELAHDGEPAHV